MAITTVKIFRIPECKLCDEMEKSLKEFKPLVYDCSKEKYKRTMRGAKRLFGKFFGYPIIIIQYEDILLVISGYYSSMINDIKRCIREMRRG